MEYKPPLEDMKFVLDELLNVNEMTYFPGYEEASIDMMEMILEELGEGAVRSWLPLNKIGDQEGCKFNNGKVTTPSGFKEVYRQTCESGQASLSCEIEHGGQGLPQVLEMAVNEMACSTNLSLAIYFTLARAAYDTVMSHGSEEMKELYLPKLASGEWGGTMCLTEPHCGTDLGIIKTRAEPMKDGTYKVTGTKMFISSGEHDLTDNIIHLVLAKLPDAPKGTRGISMILVPKFIPKEDGTNGERNSLSCGSIEHKMGVKGSATCVMNYDGATGWIVGEPNKGLEYMFTMMNRERIAVGLTGIGLGEISYQNALLYAKERIQGRDLKGAKNPDEEADPIIVHPDVRRMLMRMRCLVEGGRAMVLWAAKIHDMSLKHPDAKKKKEAGELLEMLTPIVKAFLTDAGSEVCNIGIHVYGGHGYIQEHGMEQLIRDARIGTIWEGTNGIQAMDLAGRKMPMHTGRFLRRFFHPILEFIDENKNDEEMKEFIEPFSKGVKGLQKTTLYLAQKGLGNPYEIGAGAYDYLQQFGYVTMGYLWAKMAKIALSKKDEDVFYRNKIISARFFFERMFSQTISHAVAIASGSKTTMAIDSEDF